MAQMHKKEEKDTVINCKFIHVARPNSIDYVTKWVEAKEVTKET